MLSKERFNKILNILNVKKAVTVVELVEALNTSESTIRRDLKTLDEMGKLNRVFGGATALELDNELIVEEKDVKSKYQLNKKEKIKIASYGAKLIKDKDFVYIDAGTSTEYMINYITEKGAIFVTNGIEHAKKLSARGFKVFILGGELKSSTEALVGTEAVINLNKFNFTKGFFGTNGISEKAGFTTPDVNESIVKEAAIGKCRNVYILADKSKFGKVFSVTFASLNAGTIITTKLSNSKLKNNLNVVEVEKDDLYSNI